MLKTTALAAVLGLGLAWSASAVAQETLKIGVILPYSGPFADAANQLQAGIDLYLAEHGDEVAGRKIELIKRDTGGPVDVAGDVERPHEVPAGTPGDDGDVGRLRDPGEPVRDLVDRPVAADDHEQP